MITWAGYEYPQNMKKIINIDSPCRLNTTNRQLNIYLLESPEEHCIPIEDISLLLISHPTASVTLQTMKVMAEEGVGVSFCGLNYQPISLCLPLVGHTLHSKRIQLQIDASEPMKKRAWQLTVSAKVNNQAGTLAHLKKNNLAVRRYASEVLSNDKDNVEAKAARTYWKELFSGQFKRDREGNWPNQPLNYLYAVVRSVFSRSIVGSGLVPSLGFHHSNQYNAFCLADDLIEPFRPIADEWVLLMKQNIDCSADEETGNLSASTRKYLQDLLKSRIYVQKKKYEVSTAVDICVDSYVRYLERKSKSLIFPTWQ